MRPLDQTMKGQRGFSLIELMIAMAISMVLLAALAGIFTQSISTRDKIDKEGLKIETARYSLDTLAEDIRLAGYYGNYSPPVAGVNPADWKFVSPCDVTGGAVLPGWNPTSSPVHVPFPIFGYEAHGTGALPTTTLTDCLDNYKTGTDVFVVRRASTVAIAPGGAGYVAGETYLQVSSCPDATIDTQPFHAKATATSTEFNLRILGCAAGTPARVRKLITRIYYISTCDDCTNDLDNNPATTGDGTPTLKMVELGIPSGGGTLSVIGNLRTIAPGVEDMHLEYGIDTTGDGSIDAWVVSNEDPRRNESDVEQGTAVTGMRLGDNTNPGNANLPYAFQENRWEDVMAVKLFLVTRDLTSTTGYTDAKTYVMGTKTVSFSGADAPYRRRLSSSVIKLVNMSGRREQ